MSTATVTTNQQAVLDLLEQAGFNGLTWKELGKKKRWHHGQASGVLSKLHKDGLAVRHATLVNGSSIYTLPQYADLTDAVPYGRKTSRLTASDTVLIERMRERVTDKRHIRPADVEALLDLVESLA